MASYKCKFKLKNSWGIDLLKITLRHRRHDDADIQTTNERSWQNLKTGETTSDALEVDFETGLGNRDYWWVTFQLGNGDVYSSKESFRVNLKKEDALGEGLAIVDQQGERFIIQPPKSGSDETSSIRKV